jgi:hypothetical protein
MGIDMCKRELDRYWQLLCVNYHNLSRSEQDERIILADEVRRLLGNDFEQALWVDASPHRLADSERRRRCASS